MGYRHYFYLVNTADCNKVENMDYAEFIEFCKEKNPKSVEEDDGEPYVWFPETLDQECVFEFGKLYYEDTADRIYSHGRPLFASAEMKERFYDYSPFRMGKDAMLEAIQIYKQKIADYYKGLFEDGAVQILPFGIEIKREDIKSMDKLIEHVKDHLLWWTKLSAIDLDENSDSISKSWLYEHQIFELVRLYKSIDWDTKCLLFYGR